MGQCVEATCVTRFRKILSLTAAAAALSATVVPLTTQANAVTLHTWYGYVSYVDDGDTVYVDILGDGKGPVPIRFPNLQATEMHGGPGNGPECHAQAATDYMKRMLPVHWAVQLTAQSASSTAGVDPKGLPRLVRYIHAQNGFTGAYDVDVALKQIQAGLAMTGVDPVENVHYQLYTAYMQLAQARHVGMWDTNSCGSGPSEGAALSMWAHYDADGVDGAVPNTEWLHIQNNSATDVPLSGWKLRDQGHTWYHGTTYYTFPSYAHIPAHSTITVYPGAGTNNATLGRYYLNVTQSGFFPNVSDPTKATPGKTMYLLDPQLDFRAWAVYPCLEDCAAPPVHISSVQPRTGTEYVNIAVNTGYTHPVDLSGVEVTNDGSTREINPGTVINPGETLRVYVGSGTDSRLVQYWNKAGTIFDDSGDTVQLRTDRSVVLSTYKWGTG